MLIPGFSLVTLGCAVEAFRMANERRGLCLRGRLRLELEAVLGGEVVEQVLGPARVDQVRRQERVVRGIDAQGLGIVDYERGPQRL